MCAFSVSVRIFNIWGENIEKGQMANHLLAVGLRKGQTADCWGGGAPETNLERPVGREGPVLPEAEEMQMSTGLNSTMPRGPQQQHQAQRKRTDCCKRSYLNRLGWGKGKKKKPN